MQHFVKFLSPLVYYHQRPTEHKNTSRFISELLWSTASKTQVCRYWTAATGSVCANSSNRCRLSLYRHSCRRVSCDGRHSWNNNKCSLMNRASSDKYECAMPQTVSHIMNACPLAMLSDGGLQRLHLANDDTINWLEQMAMKAKRKKHLWLTHSTNTSAQPGKKTTNLCKNDLYSEQLYYNVCNHCTIMSIITVINQDTQWDSEQLHIQQQQQQQQLTTSHTTTVQAPSHSQWYIHYPYW